MFATTDERVSSLVEAAAAAAAATMTTATRLRSVQCNCAIGHCIVACNFTAWDARLSSLHG